MRTGQALLSVRLLPLLPLLPELRRCLQASADGEKTSWNYPLMLVLVSRRIVKTAMGVYNRIRRLRECGFGVFPSLRRGDRPSLSLPGKVEDLKYARMTC